MAKLITFILNGTRVVVAQGKRSPASMSMAVSIYQGKGYASAVERRSAPGDKRAEVLSMSPGRQSKGFILLCSLLMPFYL
jgi:hypothetical protein